MGEESTIQEETGSGSAAPAGGLFALPAQLVAALRNAVDIARIGRLEKTAKTPYDVALRRPTFCLRRYIEAGSVAGGGIAPAAVAKATAAVAKAAAAVARAEAAAAKAGSAAARGGSAATKAAAAAAKAGAEAAKAEAEVAAAQGGGRPRPAVVLVPPLMLTADVYDIAPGGSAVEALMAQGIDPWVVDFGAPERQEGALERTLTDHVLAVSEAVDHVREVSGRDVHLAGYSQGGIFVYLAAAYRRSDGLASLITFGSPVNVHSGLLPGVPDEVALPLVDVLASVLSVGFARTAVPAWLSRNAFRLLSPTKEIRNQLEFLLSLHDRDALVRREGQRRFLADEGWVAWPGPAFRDFVQQMIMGNRLFSGGFVVEGQTVTMADITCPVLVFVGTNDDIARPHAVRSVADAAPRAQLWEACVQAGHMGMVIGSTALRETWPTVGGWMHWCEHAGLRPQIVVPLGQTPAEAAAFVAAGVADGADDLDADVAAAAGVGPSGESTSPEPGGEGAVTDEGDAVERIVAADAAGDRGVFALASQIGRGTVSMIFEAATEGAEAVWIIGANLTRQIPRLARLEGLRRDTRIGLALTLWEQARSAPDNTFFLYEGRAHTFADANRRVDAIVRGLLEIGVRVGEHVGVLMRTRPTALALVAAINRLGANAVLLRPDEDLATDIAMGEVEHLVTDPDHAMRAVVAWPKKIHVLGGINEPGRRLPKTAVDMERIDPERVAVPQWYTPSPGRAEDVAFVFFAGRGAGLRANQITNRRWALSAYGAASAVALTPTDTVYSWTPIQHPTGLLVSMSGALAGGARLAMAQGFSADTFWEEVRRYGASVVFYAGIMLRELVDAPYNVAERKHPVRMFAGSGMPRPLWQRLVDRFGPVDVVEFYASTQGNAILANVSGKRVGSVGRPLPGSTEVRLASWLTDRNEPVYDASGYMRPAYPGEPGMMLARVERERGTLIGRPLRNVFERGDAWTVTGSLFLQDDNEDFWLVDHLSDLIRTRDGALPSIPIEEAVWEMPGISAAAAFGLPLRGVEHDLPAVAVVLRAGHELDAEALERIVIEKLPASNRPMFVRAVDELPTTSGYRVLKGMLRAQGIPADEVEAAGRFLVWDPVARHYTPLQAASLEKLRDMLAAK